MNATKGIFVAGAVALLGAGTASAAEVKLKAASFLPRQVTFAKYFYKWADEVNKQCKGKVHISVVGPAAVPSMKQWQALKSGVVDMHYGPSNFYSGAFPAGDVMSLAQNEAADQRKNGAIKLLQEEHAKKLNAYYLTSMSQGVPFYVYTSRAIKDGKFTGFRLRSVAIYDQFLKELGATPVRMAPPAVRTALERKTVDGYGWPLWGVKSFGWAKFTKFRHGPGFFTATTGILLNLDKWKSLQDDQRKCLTDMAIWLETEFPKWRTTENNAELKAQNAAGIKYVDMGPKFKEKAEDLYWKAMAKADPEFVKKIRPLLTKTK
ncbi:MAG: TRAP transporter substrate-binding protein DctP [Hyphomicrobiales bacterium]|nr:TRAP transporter substrate-binding protein DctP [Hyphomicrobiales bacterium]